MVSKKLHSYQNMLLPVNYVVPITIIVRSPDFVACNGVRTFAETDIRDSDIFIQDIYEFKL